MPADVPIPLIALALVIVMMLGELWLSRRNERLLLARGAIPAPDPVYPLMRPAYPAVFTAMAAEGSIVGNAPGVVTAIGIAVFLAGKLFKIWAIAALGHYWTYKVLVIPGAPLVTRGPYRLMRHPNYAGVVGELVGFALITGARVTGPAGTLFFSWVMWRRMVAEERALDLHR